MKHSQMYINVLVVSKISTQAEAQLNPLLMVSSPGELWSLGCSYKFSQKYCYAQLDAALYHARIRAYKQSFMIFLHI